MCTVLTGDDNVFDVRKALNPVASRWREIGEGLGVSAGTLDSVRKENPQSPNGCMGAVVREWLKQNYSVGKFGEPTWRKLVEVVWSPVGGKNCRHARDLAKEHPGYYSILTNCIAWLTLIAVSCLVTGSKENEPPVLTKVGNDQEDLCFIFSL